MKTIVGIQDCYPFWRDANHAPWAGKPVWARTSAASGGAASSAKGHGRRRNHHHILLDDNIHNDPNDGAGGIRIPVVNEGGDGTSIISYASLRGEEALEMHGKHLIRVPTIRPLLEDDWFIRKIEEARWNVFMDEATEGNDKVN